MWRLWMGADKRFVLDNFNKLKFITTQEVYKR
jgi:hypothetical protein